MKGITLFQLPLEAKRTDEHHAVIYDATGMVVCKMAGSEVAFERAKAMCDSINAHWGDEPLPVIATDHLVEFQYLGNTYRTNADASKVERHDPAGWHVTGSLSVTLKARRVLGIANPVPAACGTCNGTGWIRLGHAASSTCPTCLAKAKAEFEESWSNSGNQG